MFYVHLFVYLFVGLSASCILVSNTQFVQGTVFIYRMYIPLGSALLAATNTDHLLTLLSISLDRTQGFNYISRHELSFNAYSLSEKYVP